MATSKYISKPFTLSTETIERIFAKIEIDDPGGCWNWTGARDRLGYGYVRFMGDVVFCHRLIYAWLVEPLPEGRRSNVPVLHHICNNPSCCNPVHLQLISHAEHMLKTPGTIGAKNAIKTHCPNGHPLPPKTKDAPRRCQICCVERKHTYYIENRDYIIAKVKKWKQLHPKQPPSS